MAFELWWFGKEQRGANEELCEVYRKKIQRYVPLKVERIKESKYPTPKEKVRDEGQTILNRLKPGDQLILLDERGKAFDSKEFAGFVDKTRQSFKRSIFLIGGAYGFSETVYQRSNAKVSMSRMTLPHRLARLFFLEQFYRAMTILNNEKYHH